MDLPSFSSALSTNPESEAALAETLEGLRHQLEQRTPNLVLAFASPHHAQLLQGLGPRLSRELGADCVLGCSGESVVGGSREVEGGSALSLWAAQLPGTRVNPFELTAVAGSDGAAQFSSLPPVERPSQAAMLLLGDPFSFPMDAFLRHLDEELHGLQVAGGLASGGRGPGQILLLSASGLRQSGAVGVILEGAIELVPVVSQGCRPVGSPWVVTDCERNLIRKLGGRPAPEVLVETLQSLPQADREVFQRGPFLGLAVDATQSTFGRGDLLVRGILGMDPNDQSIAIGDLVRRGQTVQFLMRDAASCGEDLRQRVKECCGERPSRGAAPWSQGALLFTCTGRGTRLFDVPDHDVSCIRAALEADLPLAGFFANGEIGPVGGRNFLHGFTACVALLRPRP